MLSYEPLKRTLQKKKITLTELKKLIGTGTTNLSFFAQNKRVSRISKICKALNCNIEDVVCWTKEPIEQKTKKVFRADTYNVNWEKLYSIIQEKGMTVTGVSTEMGKASNFLTRHKKNNHRPFKETIDLICKVVGCKEEDICDEV